MDSCIKFACVGDWGNGNEEQYLVGNLLSDMIKHDDIEFICGLGDNFYPNGLTEANLTEEVKEKFQNPYKQCQAPFYMVLGNHDYIGNSNLQLKINSMDDRWILPYKYYDFIMETGNNLKALFLCFDSNYNHYSQTEWDKQTEWLEKRLQETKYQVNWTILVSHHPWKSYGSHGNSSSKLKELYEKLTNKYPIDFILNGHDHDKQLIVTKNKTKQIVCGTGSTIRHHPYRTKGENLRYYAETLGVCQISLYEKKAIVKFVNEMGEQEYQSLFLPKSLIENLRNSRK